MFHARSAYKMLRRPSICFEIALLLKRFGNAGLSWVLRRLISLTQICMFGSKKIDYLHSVVMIMSAGTYSLLLLYGVFGSVVITGFSMRRRNHQAIYAFELGDLKRKLNGLLRSKVPLLRKLIVGSNGNLHPERWMRQTFGVLSLDAFIEVLP